MWVTVSGGQVARQSQMHRSVAPCFSHPQIARRHGFALLTCVEASVNIADYSLHCWLDSRASSPWVNSGHRLLSRSPTSARVLHCRPDISSPTPI
jgi:hypothetical protein